MRTVRAALGLQPTRLGDLPDVLFGVARRALSRLGGGGGRHASAELGEGPVVLPPPGKSLTVNVYVPSQCGLACTFCTTAQGSGLPVGPLNAPGLGGEAQALARQLAARAQAGENIRVLIQGRDVLNAPEGLAVIGALARVPGVAATVLTPGTRLATPGFARTLAEAAPGLNLALTLHAPDAARHDAIAGRPGAFAELHEGIRLAKAAGLTVQLTIVAARSSVGDLAATLAVARRLRCKTWVCAFEPHPEHLDTFVAAHMPRYTDVIAALPTKRTPPLREVLGVPPCVAPSGLAPHVRPPARGKLLPACSGCDGQRAGCPGPPEAYVGLYGSAEFRAMTAQGRSAQT